MEQLKRDGLTIIIVGGSGSGKSTLERKLVELAPEQFLKVISYTTRDIRPKDGEKEGETYFYVTDEVFNTIEMIETVRFNGKSYGAPVEPFLSEKDVILVAEPNGALEIKEKIDGPILIIWMGGVNEENMRKRGDSEEMIAKRVAGDDIAERFEKSGLIPDKRIKKLSPNLHLDVYEFIQIYKKNIS